MRGAVGGAVGVTVAILLVFIFYDFSAGKSLRAPPQSNYLTIHVTGHEWWWEVEYADTLPQNRVHTANEIHIPVGRPVVVMDYPEAIKAFYMRLNDDGKTVAAMDVLAPGIGEIIGGSQREERLDVLDARMAQFGLDAEHYGWYRDFRRYGTVPHAGFGLGFERTLAYVTGLANVRDAIPFPRTPGNARY